MKTFPGPGGEPLALWLMTVGLGAFLALIAWHDLRTLRIPDVWSLPLVGLGLALAYVMPVPMPSDRVIGALAGYLTFALIGHLYFHHRGVEGLGLGDAKLFGAAGAWLGWQALPGVLLIASISGLALAALSSIRGRKCQAIAFGPMLCLGFWVGWLVQVFDLRLF